MAHSTHRLTLPLSYHYALHLPDGEDLKGQPCLLCLHGYGQTLKDALGFGLGVAPDWPIAALQAPHPHHLVREGRVAGVGFGWVSSFQPEEDVANHHRFVSGVVRHLEGAGALAEPRVVLLGFSQSVSLNYRYALEHPEHVRGVIAVAGAVPSEWLAGLEPRRLRVPVLHVTTSADAAYPPERSAAFRNELEARCDDLTWLEFPGSHRVPSASYGPMRNWVERVWATT